ncbi:MAG: ABC transporter substrate-binding protein [Deltaproteobacteria bacterium]|nr:ABC transporter substrate-binding protein [Deltaproteobacteria bacterium]
MKKNLKLFLMAWLFILVWVPGVFAAGKSTDPPKYGGTLTIFEIAPGINPMSWDNADWVWKHGYDTGFYMEHLLMGDLRKGPRGTNQYDFQEMAWIPPEFVRGELLQKWEVKKKSLQVIFHLRKGVMWQEKPGIMKARELVADDVVYSMNRVKSARRAMPNHIDFIDRWEIIDQHTLIMHMKEWVADWQFRMGFGAYTAIQAPEQEKAPGGASKWGNACGTGPYMLTEYKDGHSQTYTKNPKYWDSEIIGGKKYELPFTDKVVMMLIKDEATQIASLRTGKVDLMMTINWKYVDDLKKTTPQMQWKRVLVGINSAMAMRMDTKPFNDIRVRRAMNLAINKKEIIDSFYKRNAELYTYPFPSTFKEIYTPLEKLPPSARELFSYNPEKAKKLLAEAGYPKGFSFRAQISNQSQTDLDVAAMVVAYLARIGVTLELEPMDYQSWLSMLTKKTYSPGLFFQTGHGTPIQGIRNKFQTGQTWNTSMMSDPYMDKTLEETLTNPNLTDKKVNEVLKKLIVYGLDQAPVIILPQQYVYVVWWPWVKNYYGERRVGQQRSGPIHARVWIDQEMKKKMGY